MTGSLPCAKLGVVDAFCAFFASHMIEIYFLYGLAFFVTGVVVWLEASRSSAFPAARALRFLAAFGVIHGGHEWIELFQLMVSNPPTTPFRVFRLLMLVLSFILLAEFGLRLLALDGGGAWKPVRWTIIAVFLVGGSLVWARWGGEEGLWAAADAWCRYSLAVPGAVLAAAGLFKQSRRLPLLPSAHGKGGQPVRISRDIQIVGLAFLLYGIPGQVFVGPSPLPPSTVLNSELFMQTLHFPVQLLRTVMAGIVAVFAVRALRVFELGRQRQVEELNRDRAEAQRRLNEEMAAQERLRRELLRQTVWAQEEERQHIARELHDEAGQALTAISWGLATVEEALSDRPDEARERVEGLLRLTEQVMIELRQLTTRLRPAMLDELGLVAALITYADDCSAHFPFVVDVEVTGHRRRLSPEIETTLYRITQEAITNVAKHAQATRVSVRLHFGDQETALTVSDNGVGMDVEVAQRAAACGKGWGLAGICERIQLVGGHLDIRSAPDAGTDLEVRVPIGTQSVPTREEEAYGPDPVAVG